MINVSVKGSNGKLEKFLGGMLRGDPYTALSGYGQQLVNALASATPVDSGLTATAWNYRVEVKRGRYSITLYNTNVADGIPVAIMLQYGHGTGTGGWVQGRDYINPSIMPIFDRIAEEVWEKVKRG